jgi:hypothetical protein
VVDNRDSDDEAEYEDEVEVDIQSEETVLKKAAEILSDSLMKTS